jgi:polysaccharide pyruvyl transferase WcaK-like protein
MTRRLAGRARLGRIPAAYRAPVGSVLDAFIASRYHAMLFGYLVGTPTFAIEYDQKCVSLADQIALPHLARGKPMDMLDIERLRDMLDPVRSSPTALQPSLSVDVAKLCAIQGLRSFLHLLSETSRRDDN